jgi:hypothetical protein
MGPNSDPGSAVPPATQPPASPTPAPPAGCLKVDFAAVYEAASPARQAVHTALRNLKACRNAGAVTDADFNRYQTALVAKL